jgi:tetraacyldisaccharide 4'-kinase
MKMPRNLGSWTLGNLPKFRVALYRAGILRGHSIPEPVISVGNLTVGGTGKTPFVAHIADLLLRHGKKPVILSRGYKGTAENSNLIVTEGGKIYCAASECGDEPFLLARKLPGAIVAVGKNRYESYKLLKKDLVLTTPVFILDDGFQHLQLRRDVDLVLLDGTSPFGGNAMFPFGRLREPFSAVSRATAAIITRSHQLTVPKNEIRQRVHHHNPDCRFFSFGQSIDSLVSLHGQKRLPIQSFSGISIVVLAAIGNPEQFLKDLVFAGLKVNKQFLFRDHHNYDQRDINTVIETCRSMKVDAIITTEKDLVRLEPLKIPSDLIWAAHLSIEEDSPHAFEGWLLQRLNRKEKNR